MTGAALFAWTHNRRVLQGGHDLYGDLDECEREHPPDSVAMPVHIKENIVLGVPFRFVAQNPAEYTWECLEAYWPDYVQLAPKE